MELRGASLCDIIRKSSIQSKVTGWTAKADHVNRHLVWVWDIAGCWGPCEKASLKRSSVKTKHPRDPLSSMDLSRRGRRMWKLPTWGLLILATRPDRDDPWSKTFLRRWQAKLWRESWESLHSSRRQKDQAQLYWLQRTDWRLLYSQCEWNSSC